MIFMNKFLSVNAYSLFFEFKDDLDTLLKGFVSAGEDDFDDVESVYSMSRRSLDLLRSGMDCTDILLSFLLKIQSVAFRCPEFFVKSSVYFVFLPWIFLNFKDADSIRNIMDSSQKLSLLNELNRLDVLPRYLNVYFYVFQSYCQVGFREHPKYSELISILDRFVLDAYEFDLESVEESSVSKDLLLDSNSSEIVLRHRFVSRFHITAASLMKGLLSPCSSVSSLMRYAVYFPTFCDIDDYERMLVLKMLSLKSIDDCFEDFLINFEKPCVFFKMCAEIFFDGNTVEECTQFFLRVLPKCPTTVLFRKSLSIALKSVGYEPLLDFRLWIKPLTPFEALLNLKFFMSYQPDRLASDVYFQLIGQPIPCFLDGVKQHVESDIFKRYVDEMGYFFTFRSLDFKMVMLFSILGVEEVRPFFEVVSRSHQKIMKVNQSFSDFFPFTTILELNQLMACLSQNEALTVKFSRFNLLRLIFKLYKTDLLPSLDCDINDFQKVIEGFLKESLFFDLSVIDDVAFETFYRSHAWDLISACISMSTAKSSYQNLFKILFQEAFFHQGSIDCLFKRGKDLFAENAYDDILNHNEGIRKILLDKHVDISQLDFFPTQEKTLYFDEFFLEKQAVLLQSFRTYFLDALEMLLQDLERVNLTRIFSETLSDLSSLISQIDETSFTDDRFRRVLSSSIRGLGRGVSSFLYAFQRSSVYSKDDLNACSQSMGRLKSLIKMKFKYFSKDNSSVSIRLRIWSRNPLEDFDLGEKVGCCLSPSSNQFPVMLERLVDQAIFSTIVDVWNDQELTWDVAGLIWLYIGESVSSIEQQPYLVANFYENSVMYSKPVLQFKLMEALTDYTQELASYLGLTYIISPLEYGIIPNFPELYAMNFQPFPFEKIFLVMRKLGGYLPRLGDTYYLQSVSKDLDCIKSFYIRS